MPQVEQAAACVSRTVDPIVYRLLDFGMSHRCPHIKSVLIKKPGYSSMQALQACRLCEHAGLA